MFTFGVNTSHETGVDTVEKNNDCAVAFNCKFDCVTVLLMLF